MKVLAVNSSPRGEGQSKTGLLLNHLVQGMEEAGAEVEVVELRKKTIRYCAGCFTCWTKTPGLCIHQDDMTRELFPKWLASDLVVYASPLYHYTINAAMKAFIERTLPVVQPFLERHKETTHHPLRQNLPKAVFLSVAGFPERCVFDQLSSWAQFIFGSRGNLVAEIYRPAAESLPYQGEKARNIFEAIQQAGREIVRNLRVSPETMSQINQDIIEDKETLRYHGQPFLENLHCRGGNPKGIRRKRHHAPSRFHRDLYGSHAHGIQTGGRSESKGGHSIPFFRRSRRTLLFSDRKRQSHNGQGGSRKTGPGYYVPF